MTRWFVGVVLVCALSLLTGTMSQDIVASILTKPLFEQMLKHRNDDTCPGKGLITYEGFIEAAKGFPAFGTTGDTDTCKREIAAFFAQTSHETTGGWATAPDGPYAWGYCFKDEQGAPPYDYNSNSALVFSFNRTFQFWMHTQSPIPSPHDIMTGKWTPSAADIAAGRVGGYGVITNIINGEKECGKGSNPEMEDRIGFYKRFCDILEVEYGDNLDCANQQFYWTTRELAASTSTLFLN